MAVINIAVNLSAGALQNLLLSGEKDEYYAFFPDGWLHDLHTCDLHVLSHLENRVRSSDASAEVKA